MGGVESAEAARYLRLLEPLLEGETLLIEQGGKGGKGRSMLKVAPNITRRRRGESRSRSAGPLLSARVEVQRNDEESDWYS